MALSSKKQEFVQVPWMYPEEWHEVYQQIYSGDLTQQKKAYETLLVWRARIKKLPVGIDCTLSMLHACLRDREWTLMIDQGEIPLSYEDDLCMIYSITIMRFFNHMYNLGDNTQTNLFKTAKHLKIPDWIVNIRHDTAHGYELPSLSTLRLSSSILLKWLHDEYWSPESKIMVENFSDQIDKLEKSQENEEQTITELVEQWIATNFHLHTNCTLVSEIPDSDLQEWLVQQLRRLRGETDSTDEKFSVSSALNLILLQISKLLGKDKLTLKESLINVIVNNEVFLAKSDVLEIFSEAKDSSAEKCISHKFAKFWQSFLTLLQEKKLLSLLLERLIGITNDHSIETEKRSMSAIWIKTIIQSFKKQKIAREFSQEMEESVKKKPKLTSKALVKKIRRAVNKAHPNLYAAPWLNMTEELPKCLLDKNYVHNLILNPNEFSGEFVPEILELSPLNVSSRTQKDLISLLRIYTSKNGSLSRADRIRNNDKIYTVEDLQNILPKKQTNSETTEPEIGDTTIRYKGVIELDSVNYDWGECPFGVLPTQLEELSVPLVVLQSAVRYVKYEPMNLPPIVDTDNLSMDTNAQWDAVLKKKRRTKKSLKVSSR